MLLPIALAMSCLAVDGDTLRCGAERVRMSGIDAPEMRGHCRLGRRCVKGDPIASRDSLAQALRAGPVSIERVGHDHYGRTLAVVRAGLVNLACWQLAQRQARYIARWDTGRRVARTCT